MHKLIFGFALVGIASGCLAVLAALILAIYDVPMISPLPAVIMVGVPFVCLSGQLICIAIDMARS